MNKSDTNSALPKFNPLVEGLHAARQNLVPGIILQGFALILVLGYYFIPALNEMCNHLAQFKSNSGFLYSIISTSIFGGLIPFLYLKLNPSTSKLTAWSFLPFYLLFWAFRGFDIDLLYHVQSLIFGSDANISTVVKKVLADQFIYNIIWAAPIQIIGFHWMNNHYRLTAFKEFDWKLFFTRKLPVNLVSGWGVWIPMVSIIYCLPSALQIPLFNLVLCFWVLLLTAITRPKNS